MIHGEKRTIGAAISALSPRLSKRFARRSFRKGFRSAVPTFDSIDSRGCEKSDGRNATAVRHWFAALKMPISA
jgi:hypothetical protein